MAKWRRINKWRPLKRGWRKKRLNLKKQLKNNRSEALQGNCFCGAPDRPKRHHTSTIGFDLLAYSHLRHWKAWFPIRRSKPPRFLRNLVVALLRPAFSREGHEGPGFAHRQPAASN
jgi:hypothetical protein